MTFHEIAPGKYRIGGGLRPLDSEITKSFEMMATPVTQLMWSKLKGAMILFHESQSTWYKIKISIIKKYLKEVINPSYFKTGSGGSVVNINGINIEMMETHPVENVSWTDVNEFISGLNALSGSSDPEIQSMLASLILDHKKGDIYDLPSEAQWEFVMRNRGQAYLKHFDLDNPTELQKYAWFLSNSKNREYPDGATHAVASLQPRIIEGHPFYDLEGNVWEWTKDAYQAFRDGGIDRIAKSGTGYVLRGGSWLSETLGASIRNRGDADLRSNQVGFRLIRYRG